MQKCTIIHTQLSQTHAQHTHTHTHTRKYFYTHTHTHKYRTIYYISNK